MQVSEPRADDSDALRQLNGCSIIDAFRQFVLEHPTVIAARKELPTNDSNRSVFEEGQYPGPVISYLWPISLTADGVAYDFVRPIMYFLDSPAPKASPAQQRVAEALTNRWLALVSFFQAQQLIAHGTYHATGRVEPIDRLTWRRKNVLIDMENGDLAELVNHKPIVLWRGLSISFGPGGDDPYSAIAPPDAKGKEPTLTSGEASIKAAITALWPAGIPPALSKKLRDTRIIEWQKANGTTVTSEKAIYRLLKRIGG